MGLMQRYVYNKLLNASLMMVKMSTLSLLWGKNS